ncbi:MAG: cytochrome c biogenesis protein CcdA [candidate division Zixibacteria bacterium]|nr:cytochrome c biogenesis protein CcdA [candidate division Zixibacteria bacterium]
MENVSVLAAFTAGIISFVSPCVLPLIPGYLSFISGVSMEEMKSREKKSEALKKVTLNTVLFVLGFSFVFIAFGASATFMGEFLLSKLSLFNKIAGVIIILLGLHIMGVFRIPFLNYEKRFHTRSKPLGPLGSFVVGLAFAFGWTPCIGPILGGILLLASNQDTVGKGIVLLSSYSLGLGIPFLVTAVSFNTFLGVFGRVKRHFRTIEIISGLFLVTIGFLIFIGSFGYIAGLLNQWFPWFHAG